MQHYVYKITNKTTGEYYYGKRSCEGSWRDDSYMGSGYLLKAKMKAHPDHDWHKEVLRLLETEEEAYSYEANVIGDLWQTDRLCLNLCEGGAGAGSETMKERWQDPEYVELYYATRHTAEVKAKQAASLKDKWSDPEYKASLKERHRELWQDPSHREKMSVIRNTEEFISIQRETSKAQFADTLQPLYKGSEFCEAHRSEVKALLEQGWKYKRPVRVCSEKHSVYTVLQSAVGILTLLDAGWEIGQIGRRIKLGEAKALT